MSGTHHLEEALRSLGLTPKMGLFRHHNISDEILHLLTGHDLQDLGIEKIGDRKRLLRLFSKVSISGTATSSPPKGAETISQPSAQPEPAAATAHSTTASQPVSKAAPRDRRYVNSIGHVMLPIPRFFTLVSSVPVRICDYRIFSSETGAPMPQCDYQQGEDHPVVNISWHDAVRFCDWLTLREGKSHELPEGLYYRLPSDLEWSAAISLPHEFAPTPEFRSGKIREYPWGVLFPPPPGVGNYHNSPRTSSFNETSPVASFTPNQLGFFDLGGNVWEWTSDLYNNSQPYYAIRGASCFNDDPEYLLSSHRGQMHPEKCKNNLGMRLALDSHMPKSEWYVPPTNN